MPKSICDKEVLIIYTGGTIGMQPSPDGYQPVPGYLAAMMQAMSTLNDRRMPAYTLIEYEPLIDSSDITAQHWQQIAADILANYDQYAGFVILHGTDTMAYSASMLSFLLEGLNKPVILTGAQVPIAEIHSDAGNNLIGALYYAANFNIPEVCIFFHGQLYRGNRCRKLHAKELGAFDSPNYPELGHIGTEFNLHADRLLDPPKSKQLKVATLKKRPNIITLHLSPDMPIELLNRIPANELDAIVLQTYGGGNAPSQLPGFIEALHKAAANDTLVVNITQCLKGRVDMESYATNVPLRQAGVVNGADMTPEAAYTKLFYLLNTQLNFEQLRQKMALNLRGELTICTQL